MNKMIAWMSENHVAANLLMLFFIFAGYMAFTKIKVEVFPEVSMDMIQIQVPYPGAAPDEIEESINIKIEESIKSIDGISRVTSTANENMGTVMVELELGEDIKEIKDLVKTEIDRITTFPVNAEEPIVKEQLRKTEVIQLAIYGDVDERIIKETAKQIREELLDYDEISQININGTRNYEIAIEVSENKLREFNLSFDEVTRAVRMGSLDLPGGKINSESGEILLRTNALGKTQEDYSNIILRTTQNGHIIKLSDVATITDGFEDSDLISTFNGKPSALVQLFRVGDESAVSIADRAKSYILEKSKSLPEGVSLSNWMDQSRILNSRIDLMMTNAMQGLVLVVLALALFLEIRLALWVSTGIVISFLGAFLFIGQFDASINMISLFAFILVIGIVVDDAIVVGENIYTYREAGYQKDEAAKKGAMQVGIPVFFSVSTTIAAFSPLLFVDGFMGKFMSVIPIIAISVLVLSLIESMLILPAHLAGLKAHTTLSVFKKINYFQEKIDRRLSAFIQTKFKTQLSMFLRNKYIAVASFIFIFLFTVGLIAMGTVKFVFFPQLEADNLIARITMPNGTPLEKTQDVVLKFEEAARRIQNEYDADNKEGEASIFRNMYSVIGDQPMLRQGPNSNGGAVIQSNIAEMNIELLPSENRDVRTSTLMQKWREYVGEIPDVQTMTFQADLISAGNDVQLELAMSDFDQLLLIVEEFKDSISNYSGVNDIRDDFTEGKSEFKLSLKSSAATLGITLSDLARQVRQGFYGDEAMRIQRGKDELKVMIRYPKDERLSIEDVQNMRIRTSKGGEVPFYDVADIVVGKGYSAIKRADNKRVISVLADVDEAVANVDEVNTNILSNLAPKLMDKYPGLTIGVEGAQKQQIKAVGSMGQGFLIALFVIYALLAIPFKSYVQPFIVMSAIPFGFVGAIWGHVLWGMSVSMMSLFGIVALAGIVVNDSLVLVDFINRHHRDEDQDLFDAVINACQKRFRPILLTSLTTFLGLFPIMLETSLQAQFLIPMALSLGFGVLFATGITLVLVPAGYLSVHEIQEFFKRKFRSNNDDDETVQEISEGVAQ